MATLIIVTLVLAFAGIVFGAYIKISFAIRRDDHVLGSLWSDASTLSAHTARKLLGFSSSK
jgi:hypothetical protein